MMSTNRGKQFESVIKECFLKVPGVSIDRLHDQTNGYLGSSNICDFIVYKKPLEYYVECKSIHGNTFPLNNITDKQKKGLAEKSRIKGVRAGVLCWWVDKDITKWIPIQTVLELEKFGYKSIRYDAGVPAHLHGQKQYYMIPVYGKKKRVFFDYDMEAFFDAIREH